MAAKAKRRRAQVRGALFEVVVRKLLQKAGYEPIKPDNRSIRKKDRNVRGRGCWHNIDAFGRLSYPIPYVYPIRLLAEAKCYKETVKLPVVQSFVGVLKDISENYFIRDKMTQDEMWAYNRYTDCGSIFSASDFSIDAQEFALAHGIRLISYENNLIVKNAVDAIYALMTSLNIPRAAERKAYFTEYIDYWLSNRPKRTCFSKFIHPEKRYEFSEHLDKLRGSIDHIRTSVFASAIGKDQEIQYPVHLLSYDRIPENIFFELDDYPFTVHYSVNENGLLFRVNPDNTRVQLFFSLPKSIYQEYFAEGRMLDFKEKFLYYVELPMVVQQKRRIVRFKLNREWLEEQRNNQERQV